MSKSDFVEWALRELRDPSTQESIRKAAHWLSERGLTWAEHEIIEVLDSLNKKDKNSCKTSGSVIRYSHFKREEKLNVNR